MKRWSLPLVALLLASSGLGVAQDRDSERVLFVGNSYTRFNGLPRLVSLLARSDPDGPRMRTSYETRPGWGLREHWERRRARHRIARGDWDTVVLQERSLNALEAPDDMLEYGRLLSEHARASGARVILFETWARHAESRVYEESDIEDPAQMYSQIEARYAELGRILGALVAPVGRAWLRADQELPETRLYRSDGTHPALAGSYLSACVLYGTLTGRDPRVATYTPYPLPRARAREIRDIAARVLESR